MLFEIAVAVGIGLLGLAFTIRFATAAWKLIYGIAPLVVPILVLIALYMLYAPVQ